MPSAIFCQSSAKVRLVLLHGPFPLSAVGGYAGPAVRFEGLHPLAVGAAHPKAKPMTFKRAIRRVEVSRDLVPLLLCLPRGQQGCVIAKKVHGSIGHSQLQFDFPR